MVRDLCQLAHLSLPSILWVLTSTSIKHYIEMTVKILSEQQEAWQDANIDEQVDLPELSTTPCHHTHYN